MEKTTVYRFGRIVRNFVVGRANNPVIGIGIEFECDSDDERGTAKHLFVISPEATPVLIRHLQEELQELDR